MQTMDLSESQCVNGDSSVVTTYLTNSSCYEKGNWGGGDTGTPLSDHVSVNLKQLQKKSLLIFLKKKNTLSGHLGIYIKCGRTRCKLGGACPWYWCGFSVPALWPPIPLHPLVSPRLSSWSWDVILRNWTRGSEPGQLGKDICMKLSERH